MQSCHASLEAGLKDNNQYAQTSSIVLIQISNEKELIKELKNIESLGIVCSSFYEPYDETGVTSFCTAPLGEEQRHLFKKYSLWGRAIKGERSPLTDFLKQEMKELQIKKNKSIQQATASIANEETYDID